MILLLTNRTDIHPNPVIPKIKFLGGEVFRLNTDDLLKSNKISSIPDEVTWMIENTKTGLIRRQMVTKKGTWSQLILDASPLYRRS